MDTKIIFGIFATAGMLFATSCSDDVQENTQAGNEAQVKFSLDLESVIGSRGISDGTGADRLVYAVFDKDGNRLSDIAAVSKDNVNFPTTESLILAKGQTYKVAFWAQDSECDAYTVDTDDMSVSIDYTDGTTGSTSDINNDETRDAFFKTVEFTVTGSTSIDVELKRPFAQINVGVTEEDWNAAVSSGIQIANSSVVISNVATSLNLLDGTVGNATTEITYALNAIPSETLKVDTDGDGNKESYQWLSMSYILPADATTGYEKTTLDNVSFVFKPTAGNEIRFNQGLNNVPVQRNWRTNILGKLLTGDITFNIIIDPVYEDDNNLKMPYATINGVAYTSFAKAMDAVQDGETIKLVGETALDATIASPYLFVLDGKNVTIDLNGYELIANIPDVTRNTAIFQVQNNGTLTIQGQGNVNVVTHTATGLAAFINNIGGTVNLNGGNWIMTALEYPDALIPTFVDNNSNVANVTLNINGGTYTFHRNLFRNFANAAGHNNYATVATINIYGGTFNGRDNDKGAIWNQKPSASAPEGAGVVNVMGGTFNNVVISDDFATEVSSVNDLTTAINGGKSIVLVSDIELGDATITIPADADVVLSLNGHKLTASYVGSDHYAMFTIPSTSSLTVFGDGEINTATEITADNRSLAIFLNSGELMLNGGTYNISNVRNDHTWIIAAIVDNRTTSASCATKLTINGGDYSVSGDAINLFRNYPQQGGTATLIVNDGEFHANNGATTYIWNQEAGTYLGELYFNGGTYDSNVVYEDYNGQSDVHIANGVTIHAYVGNN